MIYSSKDQWKNFDGHDNALGYKRVHILIDILEYHTYTIKSQNTYCFPNVVWNNLQIINYRLIRIMNFTLYSPTANF